jgi:hypothetical protein
MDGGASDDRVVMKFKSFVAVMVASCVLACQAGAQGSVPVPRKGSWEIVENLPRGTLVTVKLELTASNRETVHCLIHAVDATQVVCGHYARERAYPWPVYTPANPDRYVFPREEVVQVRIENEDWQSSQSSLAGAFAGATLGGVVGYNCCGNKGAERPAAAFGLSLVGALVGGTVGHIFPMVKGHVIYER